MEGQGADGGGGGSAPMAAAQPQVLIALPDQQSVSEIFHCGSETLLKVL